MAIIDNITSITTPATDDKIPVERGTTTYKIDYGTLSADILGEIGETPVPCIVLASTDTTWAKIYQKLDQITTSRAAPIHIHSNAMTVLTNSTLTNHCSGVVNRSTTGNFSFILFPLLADINQIYTFRITNASTTGATMGNAYKYSGTAV